MPAGQQGYQKGKSWNGNKKGRPTGSTSRFSLAELRKAITQVETYTGRKRLLVHFVDQAYKDNSVLISLMKKMLPDLKSVEAISITIGAGEMDEAAAKVIQKKLKKRFD